MSFSDVPVNELTLIAAAAIGGLLAQMFKLLALPFTTRERNAVAARDEAEANKAYMQQALEAIQKVMSLTDVIAEQTKENITERQMYRQRLQDQDDKHRDNIKALEKSLIDAQHEIGELKERVENLITTQDKLRLELNVKDRNTEELTATISNLNKTIAEQGKRITWLEESERQAHKLVGEKEIRIVELEKRIKELETELAHIKAQQNQPPAIPVIVAAIGATNEPAVDPSAKPSEVQPAIAEPPVDASERKADVVATQSVEEPR